MDALREGFAAVNRIDLSGLAVFTWRSVPILERGDSGPSVAQVLEFPEDPRYIGQLGALLGVVQDQNGRPVNGVIVSARNRTTNKPTMR